MKRALFVLLICFSSRLAAQQDPKVLASIGGGIAANQIGGWRLDLNAGLWAGYRLLPHTIVMGYFDYNGFAYTGYYQGICNTGYRRAFSVLIGAKASLVIPEHSTSPYFMGALGLSHFTSSQDTVYGTSDVGIPLADIVKKGSTPSFLAAVGMDIAIYRGLSVFLELRTSSGIGSNNIYDLLVMARAGIGITI